MCLLYSPWAPQTEGGPWALCWCCRSLVKKPSKSTPVMVSFFLGGSWAASANVQAFRQITVIFCQV